jgi:hypothetical protein
MPMTMEDLLKALFSLTMLFLGLILVFAQVRLFTYLPKISSQLEQISRHLKSGEEAKP